MTDDDDDEEKNKKEDKESGGGFFLIAFFVFLGSLVFKFPKTMIPLLLILFLGFICIASDDEYMEDSESEESTKVQSSEKHKLGAKFDDKLYAKTPVYEPLADGYGNRIPSEVSLLKYAPSRKNQGEQGSCTGWAVSYAARTILEAQATGKSPNEIAFSPSYLFNQKTDSKCEGAYPVDLLEALKKQGNLQYSEFPYDESSCRKKPTSDQKEKAKEFRIDGYQRLTEENQKYETDLNSIKDYLSQGSPVVVSMEVGGSFLKHSGTVWIPTQSDYLSLKKYKKTYDEGDWGGHAMTAIGYDDQKEGGAIEIMNSWGERWGKQGTFWLRYVDINKFIREAYALNPPKPFRKDGVAKYSFGLIENSSKEYIQLTKVNDGHYKTKVPIQIGTRFKVAVKNERPIYIYIFGKETDGSSYILFPYNENHSPYCGTTGTRVFPRKQSLEADDKGSEDSIVVVLAKKELNFRTINSQINRNQKKSFVLKFKSVFGNKLSSKSEYNDGGEKIELTSEETDLDTVDLIQIDFKKMK